MAIIRHVILDWSGTVVDDLSPVIEATNKIFESYQKRSWSRDEFKEKFFLPFPEFYKKYLSDVSMEEINRVYHETFKTLQGDITLLSGAKDLLDYCRNEKLSLFVLSTIHPDHFREQAPRLQVDQYFKKAYVGIMDKRKKIQEILIENELKAEETLFIGDMQHDIETAHAGGVQSGAVLTGYDSFDKLKLVGPDLIFRNLSEVKGYLERHRSEPSYYPIATVGALIVGPDGRLLMFRTQKWSNRWGIPGGKIKTNETAIDALHREVKEETGLNIRDIEFVTVQDCISSVEFYKPAHFLLLNYIAHTDETNVMINEEAEEYKWTTWDEVYELDLNVPTKVLLEEAENKLKQ
ncbi:MAG: HAD hydrolase-like protein [Verrucomicrobiota bacterium]